MRLESRKNNWPKTFKSPSRLSQKPDSRSLSGGKRKLLGKWLVLANVPIVSHSALHAIFGNRTPEEQSEFLKEICVGDILNIRIYIAYKELFDILFGGNISFSGMAEVLKKWNLSDGDKQKHTDKLTALLKVLNSDVRGGVPVKKFRLNKGQ